MKKIPNKLKCRVEEEVKMLLHASRDGLRNRGIDTVKIGYSLIEDGGYHAEAFGVMRGLKISGYGDFHSDNLDGWHYNYSQQEQNLKWWFSNLTKEVLEEEGFYLSDSHLPGNHQCDSCFKKYGKDSTRKKTYLTAEYP